nr:MAG TPA: tail protein [Caudoviricetes sp.]
MDENSYKQLFLELLPKGPAWSKDPESTFADLAAGIGKFFYFIHQRIEKSGQEIFPYSCDETLSDWEKMLELPEPCIHGNHAGNQTFQERRNAVIVKLNRRFSPTLENYAKIARMMGYTVATKTYPPAICAIARCGDHLGGDRSANYYVLTIVDGTRLTYARCGVSRCREPLCRIAYATDLECLFERIKPAHVIFKLSYTQGE